MPQTIPVRIILESPPAGVDFAVQKGSGNNYETILKQRSGTGDLVFGFNITVKDGKNGFPDFAGRLVHGPVTERFIYIDIGTAAGQYDSVWTRRLKVPLRDISAEIIQQILADASLVLETKVAGTGKDGGPNCATVKPFGGWYLGKGLQQTT